MTSQKPEYSQRSENLGPLFCFGILARGSSWTPGISPFFARWCQKSTSPAFSFRRGDSRNSTGTPLDSGLDSPLPGCDEDSVSCEADIRGDGDRGSGRGERRGEGDLVEKYGSGEDGSDAGPRSPYSERGVGIDSGDEGLKAGEGEVWEMNECGIRL